MIVKTEAPAVSTYFMPVRVHSGPGSIERLGKIVKRYGSRALLVSEPLAVWNERLLHDCKQMLEDEGLEVATFFGVNPNPSTSQISAAAETGRSARCDVVVGIGGGSSMDTAKAAAVEMTHPLSCFEYAFFQPRQPTEAVLPIVLVTTTSGTGSHVTRYSVFTHEEKRVKTTIVSDHIFAKEAIVDSSLMISVPPKVTASTGFDVFAHAFESYINVNATPYVDAHAIEAIEILIDALPRAVDDGGDRQARALMATADTLAGTCIANVGTTLPHSLGQPISGHFPQVSHGGSLAMVYPAFMDFTWSGSVSKFARVARILDGRLQHTSEKSAAKECSRAVSSLLARIGLTETLSSIPGFQESIAALVQEAMVFPDTVANPVVATEHEIRQLYAASM